MERQHTVKRIQPVHRADMTQSTSSLHRVYITLLQVKDSFQGARQLGLNAHGDAWKEECREALGLW